MNSWFRKLAATTAVLSLGSMAFVYGCDEGDRVSDGNRVSAARAEEVPLNTSYVKTSDTVPAPVNAAQPAPGFDRDMDAYQHPQTLRSNISGTADLSAPNAPVPNSVNVDTRDSFNRDGSHREFIQDRDHTLNRNMNRSERLERRSERDIHSSTLNNSNTSSSNNPGAETSAIGTRRASTSPADTTKSDVTVPVDHSANKGSPSDPSTSNNPGSEVSPSGTPRAAKSPADSSMDQGVKIPGDNVQNQGSPSAPASSNNPGAEVSPNGTPRASVTPSTNTSDMNAKTTTTINSPSANDNGGASSSSMSGSQNTSSAPASDNNPGSGGNKQ